MAEVSRITPRALWSPQRTLRYVWGGAGGIAGFASTPWHLQPQGVTVAVLWNDDSVLQPYDIGDTLVKVAVGHLARR